MEKASLLTAKVCEFGGWGMAMVASRVCSFTDPYEYQASIRALDAEIFFPSKGAFKAELTKIDFERLWLQKGSESLPRVARGAVREARVPVSFSLKKESVGSQLNGVNLMPGVLVVHSVDELHNRTSRPSAWGAMSLSPTDLAAMGRAIAGRELTRPLATHAVQPSPAMMGHLVGLHESATRLAAIAPDTLTFPEVARAMEDALIHALVRSLTENAAVERPLASLSHMKIISRMEAYVDSNYDRPIHLGELCAELGVSESTLRRCCQEYLGMAPNRYLWLRRMHLARWALLRADPISTTVTAVATDQGFWELGRFSVDYRALFGEPPSVTLRRPPLPRRADRPLDLPVAGFA